MWDSCDCQRGKLRDSSDDQAQTELVNLVLTGFKVNKFKQLMGCYIMLYLQAVDSTVSGCTKGRYIGEVGSHGPVSYGVLC